MHLVRRESKPAEATYLEAIALDPRLVGPYLQLGGLYAASGQFHQALAFAAAAPFPGQDEARKALAALN